MTQRPCQPDAAAAANVALERFQTWCWSGANVARAVANVMAERLRT